jgi:hypothetical protein
MDYATLIGPKSAPGSIANYANYGLAPATEVLLDAQALRSIRDSAYAKCAWGRCLCLS